MVVVGAQVPGLFSVGCSSVGAVLKLCQIPQEC